LVAELFEHFVVKLDVEALRLGERLGRIHDDKGVLLVHGSW